MITFHTATIEGLDVFYRETGHGKEHTLVLLHGFPSSSHMFRDLIPKLADKFHVVAPDYVGFGYSAHPSVEEFSYTFDNLTSKVEALLFGTLGLEEWSDTIATHIRRFFDEAVSDDPALACPADAASCP